jgi:hypothetical protein
MQLHVLDYVLWLTSPCLQVGVVIVMRRRGLHRDFPFFFKYNILQVISEATLVTLERLSYSVYFYSYWVIAVLCVLISFALINELFKAAFRPFAALYKVGEIIFRWAVVVGLLVAAADILFFRHIRLSSIIEGILVADRGARAMLCALVILLLLGCRYLRIFRRDLLFGISLGIAIFTFTKVIMDSVILRWRIPLLVFGRIGMTAYISACVIWLAYVTLAVQPPVVEARASDRFDPVLTADKAPHGTTLDALNDMVERTLQSWSAARKE